MAAGASPRPGRRDRGLARQLADVHERRAVRELPALRLGGDDQLRTGVGHDVGDLALAIEHVDRHQHESGLDAGEEQVDELDPVGELHRYPVARPQPAPFEGGREPGRPLRDLAEGQLPRTRRPVADEARFPGTTAEGQVEEVAEEHRGILALPPPRLAQLATARHEQGRVVGPDGRLAWSGSLRNGDPHYGSLTRAR
jgi:hypothetical protein